MALLAGIPFETAPRNPVTDALRRAGLVPTISTGPAPTAQPGSPLPPPPPPVPLRGAS
jgi:hypothetical protein